MPHRGEILKSIINAYSGTNKISIYAIARKSGYNQSSLYRHFAKPKLPSEVLWRYGKAMNHDFSAEFPELKDELSRLQEYDEKEGAPSLDIVLQERDQLRKKYIDLLEKYNALLGEKLEESEAKK